MRIALASDHAGLDLRRLIADRLRALGHQILDCGCDSAESCDYPDFGEKAARAVSEGRADRAILVCGTGIGIAMAANKVPGVRAAVVHDRFTAQMSREHNDANALALGARVLGAEEAAALAEYWLTVPFAGGRHERRVRKIDALDGKRP
jgi:ribose 5-phosphate isomerase B